MAIINNVIDTIKQLDQARVLCLTDPNNLYPQVIPGLISIIGPDAQLELRRWGTDFLAEAFSSPVLAADHKQKLAIGLLTMLDGYLGQVNQDPTVVKNVVQIATNVYQYVFRYIISNSGDEGAWQAMNSIKLNTLKCMDVMPSGVRICCIKFLQKIIYVQTPGPIADPRRPDQNEVSITLIPRDHALLQSSILEAEGSGLLDRLLQVLEDNSSDALIVTATLNCLSSLIRSRPSISNKIISTVLAFNPFALAHNTKAVLSSRDRIVIRSIAKTTMSFLINILKKTPQHPLAARLHGTIERIRQSLVDVFDETKRKRAAPDEPVDAQSNAKRQREDVVISTSSQSTQIIPTVPIDVPMTFASLFTLTNDPNARNFDVKIIPLDLVRQIVPALLASLDSNRLKTSLDTVRNRYINLPKPPSNSALTASQAVLGDTGDEDDDYEPDYPVEDREQILNDLDQSAESPAVRAPEIALGPFHLPPPPPLSQANCDFLGRNVVARSFAMLNDLDQQVITKPSHTGFNRLIATRHDRRAWITVLTRLATRSCTLSENSESTEEKALTRARFSIPEAIRETFYIYIMEDFRKRIDVAIAWLNEEWYNDRIIASHNEMSQANGSSTMPEQHYTKWLHRVLDRFLPFLEAKDKLLLRFLSEIPDLDQHVIIKVVKLAGDPDRVNLAIQALHYLLIYRPPVKTLCIDGLEDLWRNYDDAKLSAQKLLVKYRPQVVEESTKQIKAEDEA